MHIICCWCHINKLNIISHHNRHLPATIYT
ncbi:hypothetical protein UVUMRFZT_CDS0220 [Staphylococcus phage LJLAME001]